jgi:2-polyprenyl-3-methyl-5-hydroxy-6-metoxy-1,4-benzoquinol methylase
MIPSILIYVLKSCLKSKGLEYDPVKNKLGVFFNRSPFLRKLFYSLLDLLLLRTWHIHKELKLWAKTAPSDVEILDAGSGFGQYSYYLANKFPGWNILGVDVKEEQIADCNTFFSKIGLNNTHFEIADLTKFSAHDQYNLALSVDVMEHILDDVLVFKNIYTSLRENGMLLISTPSDKGGSDVESNSGESFIGEHVRNGYNMNEIEQKLKTAGFSKVIAHYSYGFYGHISWILSMKYPMKIVSISKALIVFLPFYYLVVFPFCLIMNKLDVEVNNKTGTGLIVLAWK